MRLEEIRIKNFRVFKDETIKFDNCTSFVGPNGAGKSTVLQALNVFFRNTKASSLDLISLSDQDFHFQNTDEPIEITLTFAKLSTEAQSDFQHYFRNDRLVISAIAEWNEDERKAIVEQHGKRLAMVQFAIYFEADAANKPAAELKTIYSDLRKQFPDLPSKTVKAQMKDALNAYESEHKKKCELIPESNAFYGWSKGDNRLRKYLQWIYIPAVKDVASEQDEDKNNAIGELLTRTIRSKINFKEELEPLRDEARSKYEEIIESKQDVLSLLSGSLTARIQGWTHAGAKISLNWNTDSKSSVKIDEPKARLSAGEDNFLGEIARLGHGLQRTILVSLLQELAEEVEDVQPTLLLGFEEPELYQHPPQALHMASLLDELAQKNSQIILTTHSPYFVPASGYPTIRMLRKTTDGKDTKVYSLTYAKLSKLLGIALGETPRLPESTMAAINQIMQPSQNELFFTNIAVLVEGIEDVAYLAAHLKIRRKWEEFRKTRCHFIICGGKTSMSRPLVITNELHIPAFAVFDGDVEGVKDEHKETCRKDNLCLLKLSGNGEEDPMPKETLTCKNLVMWGSDIAQIVRDDFGKEKWAEAKEKAQIENGLTDLKKGKGKKNAVLIAATMLELNKSGEQSKSLDRLCDAILEYAKVHN